MEIRLQQIKDLGMNMMKPIFLKIKLSSNLLHKLDLHHKCNSSPLRPK